jgi:hypothetical protein
MQSRHHPSGNGTMHCDSARLETLFSEYQQEASPAVLSEIISLSERRAQCLIRFNQTTRYRGEDELLSDVRFKLLRAIPHFDSARGSGFTFLSMLVMSVLRTNVTAARKAAARCVPLDETVTDHFPSCNPSQNGELLEDIADKLQREAKSALCDEDERAMQRWYIQSFCAEGFEARRHVCANCAMRAFGSDHGKARAVFDLSMLECRRILFSSLKQHKPTIPSRLSGTRCHWMARLRPLLSEPEFVKLFWLLRDLSPGTIFLIDPANHSRRQDRNQPVTRTSLLWVLDGHPLATRLFAEP